MWLSCSPHQTTPSQATVPNHHPHHPTAADIPFDLHEIFTHRLPDEVYFYLSRGLLGPQALVWLTSGQIVEPPPLDNGETTEYRRFVKEVITDGQTGPRATALALMSSVSHTFWSNRKVLGSFWFEAPAPHSQKPVQHHSQQTVQLAERVAGWNVSYAIVEEELRRQNVSCIPFLLVFLFVLLPLVGYAVRLRHSVLVVHYRFRTVPGCDGHRQICCPNEGQGGPHLRSTGEERRGGGQRDMAVP